GEPSQSAVACRVIHFDLTPAIAAQGQPFVEQVLKIGAGTNTITKQTQLTLPGDQLGLEYQIETPEKPDIILRGYLVNDRFYSITVSGPPTAAAKAEMTAFLDSFRLSTPVALKKVEWQEYASKAGGFTAQVPAAAQVAPPNKETE